MRVVFIGVSHWHLMLYLKPALEIPGVEIVGVSDPNSVVAQAAAERARCKAWVDYREMCGATRPDSAFALGRYCDMAELARFLIEHRNSNVRAASAPASKRLDVTFTTSPSMKTEKNNAEFSGWFHAPCQETGKLLTY